MGTRRIKPRTKPPKKQPNKGNTALSWWDKHSQNNKYRYGILLSILSLFLIIWIVIGAVNLTVKPVETTVTDTPAPPAQTPPAVNSSPTQSEEDSYSSGLKKIINVGKMPWVVHHSYINYILVHKLKNHQQNTMNSISTI